MKSAHSPRFLVILILILVGVAFIAGTLRLIRTAHAAESPLTTIPQPARVGAGFISRAVSISSQAGLTETPLPAEAETDPAPQGTPTAVQVSADTSGIIALAIVIVATILVGAAWGVRRPSPKKTHPR